MEAEQRVWKACIPQRGTDGGPITEGWYVCRREKWWIRAGGTTGAKKNKQSVDGLVLQFYTTPARDLDRVSLENINNLMFQGCLGGSDG